MKRRDFLSMCLAAPLLSALPARAAGEKTRIRLAAQATSGQVFQYLAKAKGYLDDEGVEVEMVYINNGVDAFSALSSGKVDVISTYGTGGPLIQIANGQRFTIFGGYMITGATPVFALPGTEYKGVESLRGKKIAIMRGGTPDIVLKGILHDTGMDVSKDVTFVEIKRNQDVMEAVRGGICHFGAVSTGFEPQIKDSGMQVVMWPDELWPAHSCCRMLSRSDWLDANQDGLTRLLRAYLRAERDMRAPGGMEQVVALTMKELDMPEQLVRSFVQSPHLTYETDPSKKAVVTMWNKMQSFGYIKDPHIDINDHINVSVYKAALDALLARYPSDAFFGEKLKAFNTVDV
ncbi:NitT/TauT family transport system substrate-binding protein [Rhodoblastus acidophilus]|uniref:ABC transporter substrate-binding protein n=1 Tax=Rhodoblastus acidophilus TaxID=1074 RepID=UPI002225B209|nr:ABC transporter substrate-binding protein [Rhodoblastus acidophilus]MCW2285432.1 NitT/TauT family transport system substrate-binding protein [Rhodoblastus acidophilus]MCW2334319.1 NitT/TauT family transport system substrate-binding protein [Rhodoblastus acidophilus]